MITGRRPLHVGQETRHLEHCPHVPCPSPAAATTAARRHCHGIVLAVKTLQFPPLPRQPRVREVPRPAGSLRSIALRCCTATSRSAQEHEHRVDELDDSDFEALAIRPGHEKILTSIACTGLWLALGFSSQVSHKGRHLNWLLSPARPTTEGPAIGVVVVVCVRAFNNASMATSSEDELATCSPSLQGKLIKSRTRRMGERCSPKKDDHHHPDHRRNDT